MIRKNSKIWSVLANDCETPGEFIRSVMLLRNENSITLGKKMGTSSSYINMTTGNQCVPDYKACVNFAKALYIDPFLLGKVCMDYKIKQILEKDELQPNK